MFLCCAGLHFLPSRLPTRALPAGDSVCRVYDVDAKPIQKTVVGDMYVRDTANTKGHTHMLTDACWHPTDRNRFLTSSLDATIRTFDLTSKPYGIDQALPHVQCMKIIDKRNLNISKCNALCLATTSDGLGAIAGGAVDGSIQLWNEKRSFGKPVSLLRDAHTSEVTRLTFKSDNNTLLSRAADDSLKVWDIRSFKQPVKSIEKLPNAAANSKVALGYSPCEKIFYTSCCATPKQPDGCVKFYSSETLEEVHTLTVKGVSVGPVYWSEPLDQLVIGCGNGSVRMLYDPLKSSKGALLFVSRAPTKKSQQDGGGGEFNTPVFTMEQLPEFNYKETRSGTIRKMRPHEVQRYQEKTQKTITPPRPHPEFKGLDPTRSKPGGFSQYVAQTMGRRDLREEDPVEVLRSYDEETKDNPFFTRAYKKTQPKPVLDYNFEEGGDQSSLLGQRICPKCGLKQCTCGFMAQQQKDDETARRLEADDEPPTKQQKTT